MSHSHSCGHDHNCAPTRALTSNESSDEWKLYLDVDMHRCSVLNEEGTDSLKKILRPWSERTQTENVLRSDADEQLLIYLPFHTAVKLKAICLIGGGDEENPRTMKAFLNIDSMDFASAESTKPIQTWDLVAENRDGQVEYRTQFTKFQNVRSLWLFISENFGAEHTTLQYLGLKGQSTSNKRQAVNAVYELRPQPADHKNETDKANASVL